MKNINIYIQEALINKNTKIKKHFSDEYVLFVPYRRCYSYILNNEELNKYLLNIGDRAKICLINIKDAYDIYIKLPDNHLSNEIVSDRSNWDLSIFRIPKNIDSIENLKITLNKNRCQNINVFITEKDDLWERITDEDQLKLLY
jgi:hypothetical protein